MGGAGSRFTLTGRARPGTDGVVVSRMPGGRGASDFEGFGSRVRATGLAVLMAWAVFGPGALAAVEPRSLVIDLGGFPPNAAGGMTRSFLGDAPGGSALSTNDQRLAVYLGPALAAPEKRAAVLSVALALYREAQGRADLWAPPVTPEKTRAAEDYARDLTARVLESRRLPGVVFLPGGRRLLGIRGLGLFRSIDVRLANLEKLEGLISSGERREKFRRKRILEEQRLAELLMGETEKTDEYPVPPRLPDEEIERRLRPERRVRLAETPKVSTNELGEEALRFELERLGRPLGIEAEVGVAYSTTENVTGNAAVTLKNLLRRTPRTLDDPYDVLDVKGRAGPQVRGMEGTWDIPLTRPRDPFTAGVRAVGDYRQDDRTAFEGLSSGTVEASEWSTEVTLRAAYDSHSLADHLRRDAEDPARRRFEILPSLESGLRYEGSWINDAPATTGLEDGSLPVWRGRLGTVLIWDLYQPHRAGIGEVEVEAAARWDQGFDSGDGDFDYSQWQAAGLVKVLFGWEDARDWVFRQSLTTGGSHGRLPDLSQFRLGGGQPVRGLQEGERSGRSMVATATELGINLGRLVRRPARSTTSGQESGAGAEGGEDGTGEEGGKGGDSPLGFLEGMYLTAFFDWGRTSPEGSAGDAWEGGRSATGFGVLLEVPKQALGRRFGSLSVGYAYSPDSELHRGGVFVVSAGFPF